MIYKKFLFTFIFTIQLISSEFHWQISHHLSFDWVHPDLEGVSDNLPGSCPDDVIENDAYLRYRILQDGKWSSWSLPSKVECKKQIENGVWVKPENIDENTWHNALPYLLPYHHPLKDKLDSLFCKKRHVASFKAMVRGGFTCLELRNWDNILVASHPTLKGYLIKTYVDEQYGISELDELLKRIHGAHFTRQAICDFNLGHLFKVPHKWLYPLPSYFSNDPNLQPKQFLLIVEDMSLVSDTANPRKWYNKPNKALLKALFQLLSTIGLKDSVFISNIPYSKDGKIAFIDTEHYHQWPIAYHRLNYRLRPEMEEYWNLLIHTNGQAD